LIRLFIFDLDGVITETAEYHYQAWRMVAVEENLQFSTKQNLFLKGLPRIASMEKILELNNISNWSNEKIVDVADRKNRFYKKLLETELHHSDVSEGAISLLETIKSKGYPVAIASSSKNASYIMTKLNLLQYFDLIADGNLEINMKPYPDIFLHVANKLDIAPADCIVFEDSQSGIDAAKCARMLTVGIDRNLKLSDCDYIYKCIKDFKLDDIGIT